MTLIKTTILLSYYFKCYFILCTGIIAILCLVLHQNFAKSNNHCKKLAYKLKKKFKYSSRNSPTKLRTLITTTILLLYYLQILGFF